MRKILNKIREITPLSWRIKIGPFVAYCFYVWNVYIRRKRTPKILSIEETVDLIIKENLSVVRFGDGEMSLMDKVSIPYQRYDEGLANRMKSILQTDQKGLLVCIPSLFGKMNMFTKLGFNFNIHHVFKHGYLWDELLSLTRVYGNTLVSRPYVYVTDRSRSGVVFEKWKSIWKNKDIVMIEGARSKNGIGNDFFDNAKSVERLQCPNENAYFQYDEIKERALRTSKEKLILIALGPTAKPLAYDLFQRGYRVMDIGHLDIEYEMYVKGQSDVEIIPHKYAIQDEKNQSKDL